MTPLQIYWWVPTAIAFLGLFLGGFIGYVIFMLRDNLEGARTDQDARTILEKSKREAERLIHKANVEAHEKIFEIRETVNMENLRAKEELRSREERLMQRDKLLEEKAIQLENKLQRMEEKALYYDGKNEELEQRRQELDGLIAQEHKELEQLSGLSCKDAEKQLLKDIKEEVQTESGSIIKHVQEEARATAECKAREIITCAIQRYAADQVTEVSTSAVHLPSDDMKGRIIGKEGRNIRAFAAVAGVDILIDDTPETVIVSGFDPIRREIARIALERLISDGRIHPARIEEMVTKVRSELEDDIRRTGEKTVFDLGLPVLPPELTHTLGMLKYRHSYGQNVLTHSIETAHLMATMAAELGLDIQLAKRIGIFHDIGKALDHKTEGSHAIIGADLLKKYDEDEVVLNAVASHHGDVEATSLYATLVSAADAITAARPGARSESTDIYIKRLEKLEEIARGFRGVTNCYAIQAGREIRVIVEPSVVDDNLAMQLARNISSQIKEHLRFTGQIKVTVIRETRCIEFAR